MARSGAAGSSIIAVDVGGTCTDCVVFSGGTSLHFGKAFSTPPHFAEGVIDAVRRAAAEMGLELEALLGQTTLFLHGSTVVDNAIFTREGARTGLITTAGFEDTLLITRGAYGRWSGQPEEAIKHPVASTRPASLVPRSRIVGVRERVDQNGVVVLPLDERTVEEAVRKLVEVERVDAIAVCLLWSFRNPQHEQRIREIIRGLFPHVHVSISFDAAPVPGEYERTSTTVIDAYAGTVTKNYLEDLSRLLRREGFDAPLLVMQGYGGLVPFAEAAAHPVGMIECGPAAGVVGARYLGHVLGSTNVIAADMGGTTFKVGVIQDGEIDRAREPIVDRFHYVAAKLEVVSIGAGGGSIVGVDPRTGRPSIGPASAGARPGPVCYGFGGAEPTLTDVAAILGYMDSNAFLGGTVTLDIERARRVFEEKIARPLSMDADAAAIGIYQIATAQIADLVREVTVERGLDPRDFVLHSFGGSCGLFAGAFAKELAIRQVVVPYTASVNCAFGMVAADVVHEFATIQPEPWPTAPERVNQILEPMADRAMRLLHEEGFSDDAMALEWAVDLRYRRQVHQVSTPLRGGLPIDAARLGQLIGDFERLYERRYGRGSAFRAAGVELVTFRLKARGIMPTPAPVREELRDKDAAAAEVGSRRIYVDVAQEMRPAKIYDFQRLHPGNVVLGPAVIHTPITTVVVQGEQVARMDPYRNLILEAA